MGKLYLQTWFGLSMWFQSYSNSNQNSDRMSKSEDEPLSKKAKLSSQEESETSEGPKGTSLLDTYKIDGGGDRIPVELMDESHKSQNSGTKNDPSTDEGHLPKNDKSNRYWICIQARYKMIGMSLLLVALITLTISDHQKSKLQLV